jgi:hypothetical protein
VAELRVGSVPEKLKISSGLCGLSVETFHFLNFYSISLTLSLPARGYD